MWPAGSGLADSEFGRPESVRPRRRGSPAGGPRGLYEATPAGRGGGGHGLGLREPGPPGGRRGRRRGGATADGSESAAFLLVSLCCCCIRVIGCGAWGGGPAAHRVTGTELGPEPGISLGLRRRCQFLHAVAHPAPLKGRRRSSYAMMIPARGRVHILGPSHPSCALAQRAKLRILKLPVNRQIRRADAILLSS